MAGKSRNFSSLITSLSYENTCKDSSSIKYLTGLSTEQFDALHSFLDSICPLDDIAAYRGKNTTGVCRDKRGWNDKLTKREKLFICLVRLRRGFTLKTLSILLGSPTKSFEQTIIRRIFTTFIQLMYKVFREMETVMFPSRAIMLRYLPRVFKTIKKI